MAHTKIIPEQINPDAATKASPVGADTVVIFDSADGSAPKMAQIGTFPTGAPSGAAGGDLAATYPNPEVAKASKTFSLTGVVTYAGAGGSLNDFNPTGLNNASVLIMTVAALVTGIVGGTDGRLLLLIANGAAFSLSNENILSSAINRFDLAAATVTLKDGQGVMLRYNGSTTRWQQVFTANAFSGLSDVDMTGLANGDYIRWDEDNQVWIPSTLAVLTFNDAEGDPAPIGTAADGTSIHPSRRDHVHAAAASAVSNTPAGNIAATDVQAALNELDTEKAATGHVHAASAITNTPAGGIAATDVQAAINELDTEKSATGHTHSYTAANIANVPAGNIAATDVQAALNELDTEKSALASAVMDGDTAGGDLSGTYPNPAVVDDSHNHSASTLSGVVKSGDTAGGDLAGTYPNPTVAQASKSFARSGVITGTLSGFPTVDEDYNPTGLADASVIVINESGVGVIGGLVGGATGRIVTLVNIGSARFNLIDESASSTVGNRFALGRTVFVYPKESVSLVYYSSRWRLLSQAFQPTIQLKSVTVLDTAGSGTYTVPSGITTIEVELIGAGGGSGGCSGSASNASGGAGGGAGAYLRKLITAPSATYSYTVGAGGSGGDGATAATGGNGTSTTFGTLTAAGGSGGTGMAFGTAAAGAEGGNGGTLPTTGDVNVKGNGGSAALRISGTVVMSGAGGAGALGGTSRSRVSLANSVAGGAGSGGSGGVALNATDRTGGAGGDGLIVVYEYGS